MSPTRLSDARVAAHHALQSVSRAARAALPARADDSHSNLGWDHGHDALFSHDLTSDGARLGLRLNGLKLLALQDGAVQFSLAIGGRNRAEVRRWVEARLRDWKVDASGLDDDPGYVLADDPTADGAVYETVSIVAELDELSLWFSNAASVLDKTAQAHTKLEPGPSAVRCWPHHFDLATLISLDAVGAENGRSIGVGFSPGDENYSEPYFYVSPWPYPDSSALPSLDARTRWHTVGFTSAVTLGADLVTADLNEVVGILDRQIDLCTGLLTHS